MSVLGWLLVVGGVGVVVANLRTQGPLWACPGLERSQKIAQTVILWLIPGSYLLVRQTVLSAEASSPADATSGGFLGAFWFTAGMNDLVAHQRRGGRPRDGKNGARPPG